MTDCKHEFAYSELHREFVCKKCFHVLTEEEKQEALEHANAMRRREEAIEQAYKKFLWEEAVYGCVTLDGGDGE